MGGCFFERFFFIFVPVHRARLICVRRADELVKNDVPRSARDTGTHDDVRPMRRVHYAATIKLHTRVFRLVPRYARVFSNEGN